MIRTQLLGWLLVEVIFVTGGVRAAAGGDWESAAWLLGIAALFAGAGVIVWRRTSADRRPRPARSDLSGTREQAAAGGSVMKPEGIYRDLSQPSLLEAHTQAFGLMRSGATKADAQRKLETLGIRPDDARGIVVEAEGRLAEIDDFKARQRFKWGVGLTLFGSALTAVSCAAGGATFYIFIGPIVAGVWMMLRGSPRDRARVKLSTHAKAPDPGSPRPKD